MALDVIKKAVASAFKGIKGVAGKVTNKHKDESAIMSEYDDLINDEGDRRAKYEKSWFVNIAFLLNHQWVQWNDYARKFDEPKAPDWRVRLSINKILPRYRKALNDIGSYDPRAVCTPNSNEESDIEAAETGTKVLASLNQSLKMRVKNNRKTQWQLICGSSFLHYFWNSELGEDLPDVEEIKDPETGEVTQKKSKGIKTGDVDCEVVSAFEIYPIYGGENMDNVRGIAWVRYTSVDELKMKFPKKAHLIKEEDDFTLTGMFKNKIESLVTASGSYATNVERDEKKALYKRVWVRPSPEHKKGHYIAYVNGVLLEESDTPDLYSKEGKYMGKEFEIPFCKYDDLEVPGRFWGQATIEQAIPLNKEYNKTRSQMIESRNMMGKPKWTSVKSCVNKRAITSEPGEVIEWNPNVAGAAAPVQVPPVPLPAYIGQIADNLNKDLNDVQARHEVSASQVPSGVKSGKAIRELKAGDESEMGAIFLQAAENKKIYSQAFLKLVQEHYTEQRVLKVVGENNAPEVMSFMGSDLRGNTDVWVESDDIMPTSRTGRQNTIMDWYEAGLLGDTADDNSRRRTLRMMKYGSADELWNDISADAKYARHENKEMAKGIEQKAEGYEDQQVHIQEVLRPIKSVYFKKKDPRIQEIYLNHLKQHQDWLAGGEKAAAAKEEPGSDQVPGVEEIPVELGGAI